jgi:hypothetical protein
MCTGGRLCLTRSCGADGLNREIPHLFPRADDRHDFHKAGGGDEPSCVHEGKGGVLGNLGGFAKLATNSITEILKSKGGSRSVSPTCAGDVLVEEEEVKMLHAGTWNVDEPEHVSNLELPVMQYKAQWFGEEKMGGVS